MINIIIKKQPDYIPNHPKFIGILSKKTKENNIHFFTVIDRMYIGSWDIERFKKLFDEEKAKWCKKYRFNGEKWVKR